MTRNKLTGEPPRTVRPGQRLHVDVFGGGKTLGQDDDIGVPLGDGIYKYVMLITDDATRRRWAIPLPRLYARIMSSFLIELDTNELAFIQNQPPHTHHGKMG